MKKILLLSAFILSSLVMKAQNEDPWTKYMMTNEIHSLLAQYAGSFDMEITMWMTADAEPIMVTLEANNKMILGNRFLEIMQKGNMMGTDYISLSTLGFNTINMEFSLTTLTNMGTGTLHLTGTGDEKNKQISLNGYLTNPMDGKPLKVRQQITFMDKDHLLLESFDTFEGQAEKKSMQYKLTRK